jgi:hypothetical protein
MGFGLRDLLAFPRHSCRKRQRFTAMSRLPVSEVFRALFLGKLLKYGVYGWLAAEFPSWFQRFAPIGEHKHQTRTP